jgi:hypothetical protein
MLSLQRYFAKMTRSECRRGCRQRAPVRGTFIVRAARSGELQAAAFESHVTVRQLVLDRLERRDGLSELLALLAVTKKQLETLERRTIGAGRPAESHDGQQFGALLLRQLTRASSRPQMQIRPPGRKRRRWFDRDAFGIASDGAQIELVGEHQPLVRARHAFDKARDTQHSIRLEHEVSRMFLLAEGADRERQRRVRSGQSGRVPVRNRRFENRQHRRTPAQLRHYGKQVGERIGVFPREETAEALLDGVGPEPSACQHAPNGFREQLRVRLLHHNCLQ